nr:hypothetical protein [Tanacetum cinerariifolium]
LTLQTSKKKSPADQFIFQRRTSIPTGSFGHDESSSLYVELRLTDSEAGPNPDDTAASQPLSSPVVQAGPNLEHMDLEATDVSAQPHPKQMDKGFTVTAYPKVQENLKLTVKEQKTTAETKAESMVSAIIQQDTSLIPPMTRPIVDLTSRPDSPNVHRPLQATATETTTTTTTTTHPPPPQPQQSTTVSMLMKRIGELEDIMANLIQDNKHLEESAIRKNMSDSKWSRPAGFQLAREYLQSRVKEEDSVIDVENAIFDFRVIKPLSFLLVDQRVFISLITELCAQAQSVDDMPFRKQACMEYTQWVFCKLFGRPRERHLACPTRMHEVRTTITDDSTGGSKSGKERFKEFANNSSVVGGERFRFNPFRQVVNSYDVVRAMMSPGGSLVASLENVNGFLVVYTPSDDLIHTDFEKKGVVSKVMLHILEEFVFLLGRHSLDNEIPRMVVCKVRKL